MQAIDFLPGLSFTYVRGSASPDFMVLLEKTFGKEQTTRTWETIVLVAR